MKSYINEHILRFIACILLQIFLVSKFSIFGYAFGFIYILFLLKLPVSLSKPFLLLLAFITGFIIDIFSNSLGLHSASCLFMMLVRPFVLSFLMPRGGYDDDTKIDIQYMGFTWFFKYSIFIIFIHHSTLFFLEIFSFQNFWVTLLKILLSSFLTLFLIFSLHFIFKDTEYKKI
ncbi:MAG: hypothetical protein A3G23_07050 [Bacteroidetes bacterium RIFCSPLOWO2_12_FULL_37_12]|nr:MAG: hypothetical protein A3G23_07050 [Bacteroidetes bacterium RIFCSPLOWO2_12_FULL_37_12]